MEEEVCSICGEIGTNSTFCRLPCNHMYCLVCIGKYCASSEWFCPKCHNPFVKMTEIVDRKETGFFLSAKSLASIYQTNDSSSDGSNSFHAGQPVIHSEEEQSVEKKSHMPQSPCRLNTSISSNLRSSRTNRVSSRPFNSPHLSLFGES